MGCGSSRAPGAKEQLEGNPAYNSTETSETAWLSVPSALGGKLNAHDFTTIYIEKQAAHLEGTREWAFTEIFQWLDASASPQLFWLVGGGGTGKSVLGAELLRRAAASGRAAAWHFCRHTEKSKSEPVALLKSVATMLCHTIDGFLAALGKEAARGRAALDDALDSDDAELLFDLLLSKPLQALAPPKGGARFILIDALDELPPEAQQPLLSLLTSQLHALPSWLRLFVTSREEPTIKAALSAFKPRELRATEARNRADVERYLRTIAIKHVKGEVNTAEIEAEAERRFGINLAGKLAVLQEPMNQSRTIYADARAKLSADHCFKSLLDVPEKRDPDLVQASNDFDIVYGQAPLAQKQLLTIVANDWEPNPQHERLRQPKAGQAKRWVELADDPGVKGIERSKEKMKNEYGGQSNRLKDLARVTLRFTESRALLHVLRTALQEAGVKVLTVKNKFASPTPMGYSDFNMCVAITLDDGIEYVCELQLNLQEMVSAKRQAHVHYEQVREMLPVLCQGTAVDPLELEAFIVSRLKKSAVDAAVSALAAKADGLFLYAFLLEQHLYAEAAAGREIHFGRLDTLPAGLSDIYEANFIRSFPDGADDAGWMAAKPLIELIVSAMQPITVGMAEALLGWDAATKDKVLALTGLLFPVHNDTFDVLHKTVIDWLTGEVDESSSISRGSDVFAVERARGHAIFASGFLEWLNQADASGAQECARLTLPQTQATIYYYLLHGLRHLYLGGQTVAAEAMLSRCSCCSCSKCAGKVRAPTHAPLLSLSAATAFYALLAILLPHLMNSDGRHPQGGDVGVHDAIQRRGGVCTQGDPPSVWHTQAGGSRLRCRASHDKWRSAGRCERGEGRQSPWLAWSQRRHRHCHHTCHQAGNVRG